MCANGSPIDHHSGRAAAPVAVLSRGFLARASALAMAALAATACSSDDGGDGKAAAAAAATASGGFAVTIDGQPFAIDYKDGQVSVEVVHKKNADPAGYGCITSLLARFERKDGTCRLELRYEPAGPELKLASATFAAVLGVQQGGVVVGTKPCDGFPGATGTAEIVYKLAGGQSVLQTGPVGPPEASKTLAKLAGRTLQPSGTVQLQHKGKLFDLDTSALKISGDLESVGSDAVSCGAAVGVDVCPKGVTYGGKVGEYVRRPGAAYACVDQASYDLGEFCGRPLVLMAYQHWVANPQRNPDGHETFSGRDVLLGLAALHKKYGKDVGFAVVVLSGAQKVVVEDPAQPGKYMIGGPAPTQQDCEDIRGLFSIPDEVVMLYDKDRVLNSLDKRLIDANNTPALLTANSKGEIVAILPAGEAKLEPAAVEAAVEAAIAAN